MAQRRESWDSNPDGVDKRRSTLPLRHLTFVVIAHVPITSRKQIVASIIFITTIELRQFIKQFLVALKGKSNT
jgi:hypothetical protein